MANDALTKGHLALPVLEQFKSITIIRRMLSVTENPPLNLIIETNVIPRIIEIFVHTEYNSNLFTIISTLIEQTNLTVMDARVFTSQDNYTLDTFLVLEADGSQLTNTLRIEELKEKLTHYITQPETATPGITTHIPRAAKHFKFPTQVSFDNNDQQNQTMMKVVAYDRPGILSEIGSAMHACGVTLHKAKIATFGEKAEDIFFITNNEGNSISDEEQLDCLKQTIIEGLEN